MAQRRLRHSVYSSFCNGASINSRYTCRIFFSQYFLNAFCRNLLILTSYYKMVIGNETDIQETCCPRDCAIRAKFWRRHLTSFKKRHWRQGPFSGAIANFIVWISHFFPVSLDWIIVDGFCRWLHFSQLLLVRSNKCIKISLEISIYIQNPSHHFFLFLFYCLSVYFSSCLSICV